VTVLTSLNKFANSEVELRGDGGVNAPVGDWLGANSVYTKDATQLHSHSISYSDALERLDDRRDMITQSIQEN